MAQDGECLGLPLNSMAADSLREGEWRAKSGTPSVLSRNIAKGVENSFRLFRRALKGCATRVPTLRPLSPPLSSLRERTTISNDGLVGHFVDAIGGACTTGVTWPREMLMRYEDGMCKKEVWLQLREMVPLRNEKYPEIYQKGACA